MYDISTSAVFTGAVTVSLSFRPAAFHKPASVRLFHLEGGVWVDRTVSSNGTLGLAVARTASLSPFALFEPENHAPTAGAVNPSILGSNSTGTPVKLDGSSSSDVDGDALTYRWNGPFPEGNGAVTGVTPTVTLPFGTTTITWLVNDRETVSSPTGYRYSYRLCSRSAAVGRG